MILEKYNLTKADFCDENGRQLTVSEVREYFPGNPYLHDDMDSEEVLTAIIDEALTREFIIQDSYIYVSRFAISLKGKTLQSGFWPTELAEGFELPLYPANTYDYDFDFDFMLFSLPAGITYDYKRGVFVKNETDYHAIIKGGSVYLQSEDNSIFWYILSSGPIKYLEDFAEYINASEDWPNDATDIIEANGWFDETGEEWGICNDWKTGKVVFGEDGKAVVVHADAKTLLQNNSRLAVAAQIRDLRLKSGLTQQALGEKTGYPRPQIVKFESGRIGLTCETLTKIAHAMGCEITLTKISK